MLSTPKHFTIFLFFCFQLMLSMEVFSQLPSICKTQAAGYYLDSLSNFAVSPSLACTDISGKTTVQITSKGSLNFDTNNLGYVFNFKEGMSIPNKIHLNTDTTLSEAGIHWVLQYGNVGNKIYYACKSYEVLTTKTPEVSVSVCASGKVVVTILKNSDNYSRFRIDWGDKSNFSALTVDSTFTYPHTSSIATHIYDKTFSDITIVVIGDHVRDGFNICTSNPNFSTQVNIDGNVYINRLEMISKGTGAIINFANSEVGKEYSIKATKTDKKGNITYITLPEKGKDGKATLSNLDSTATYCFNLEYTDLCGNVVPSNPVCSINLTSQIISTSSAQLNWNNPGAAVPYEIKKIVLDSTQTSTSVSQNPIEKNSYLDSTLVCSKQYSYQIIGTYFSRSGDLITTISASKSISTNSSAVLPALAPFGMVSVEHNLDIKFSFYPNGFVASKYRIFRSIDKGNASQIAEQIGNNKVEEYTDMDVKPLDHQYCYQVAFNDECNNWSQKSLPICSILLTTNGTSGSLSWTTLIDDPSYKNNVYYDVYEADSITGQIKAGASSLLHTQSTSATMSLPTALSISYIVTATYSPLGYPNAALIGNSNYITLELPARIFVPTAFTPNGANPIFKAKGIHIQDYKMIIYNRWGNPVFETIKLDEGWDGTTEDHLTQAPAGAYSYIVFLTDSYGVKSSKTGSLLLIR